MGTRRLTLTCPCCEQVNDVATEIEGDIPDGAISLCAFCCQPSRFEAGALHRLTPIKTRAVMSDERVRKMIWELIAREDFRLQLRSASLRDPQPASLNQQKEGPQ